MIERISRYLIIGMTVCVLFIVVIVTRTVFFSSCSATGANVCYLGSRKSFAFEANAVIQVTVPNETIADAIRQLWAEQYPQQISALQLVVSDPLTEAELSTVPYDIYLLDHTLASYHREAFLPLNSHLINRIKGNDPFLNAVSINYETAVFVPMSGSSWSFVYNAALLETAGIALDDVDGNGLPDAVQTWEQIFALAENWQQSEALFPVVFSDAELTALLLSAGGWHYFGGKDAGDAGFASETFQLGLQFIQAMAQAGLTGTDSLAWHLEDQLYSGQTVFSASAAWMSLIDEYQEVQTLVIAPFPSYQGVTLSPPTTVLGYVINVNTDYPSAAHEVMQFLRSADVISLFANQTDQTMIYDRDHLDQLTIDQPQTMNRIRALTYGYVLPHLALASNAYVDVARIVNDIDLRPYAEAVYLGTLTPQRAQAQIVDIYEEWMNTFDRERN